MKIVLVSFVQLFIAYIIFVPIELMYDHGNCNDLYLKYRIQSQIGRGASGVCYRVQHNKSKELYAMKKIHISSIRKQNTKEASNEVTILSKLNHPNIIKLYQSFSDENHLYIIMQYASKGDLHHMLKRRKIRRDVFLQKDIWEMGRQLLTALEYLHSLNIIHRDVKTLNIFMDPSGKLYLGDLGVSKLLKTDHNGLYSRVGTPLYLAPQIIKYQKYDYKADIWGLGCVIYQLAALTHPFQGKNIITLGQNIVNAQVKPINDYSQELNDFITDLLQKNPSKRMSATQLLKKYYKEGVPNPVSFVSTVLLPEPQIKQQSNAEIIAEKSANLLKNNQIRKKIVNNFVQGKLSFGDQDKIRDEPSGKSANNRPTFKDMCLSKLDVKGGVKDVVDHNLEDTVIYPKKINKAENKKYVQATHKTHMVMEALEVKAREHSCKLIREDVPAKEIVGQECKLKKIPTNTLQNFCSQKKVKPTMINSHSTKGFQGISLAAFYRQDRHKKTDISIMNQQFKAAQNLQSNRLSTDNQLQGTGKVVRIRPKSSIMTKQRHESTMKNIKKSVRRLEVEDMGRWVETKVLKQPQMIFL